MRWNCIMPTALHWFVALLLAFLLCHLSCTQPPEYGSELPIRDICTVMSVMSGSNIGFGIRHHAIVNLPLMFCDCLHISRSFSPFPCAKFQDFRQPTNKSRISVLCAESSSESSDSAGKPNFLLFQRIEAVHFSLYIGGQNTMAAFVTAPARLPSANNRTHSICSRNAAVRVPRRSRMVPSMCAEAEGETTAAEESEMPKEPHPGFYADMKRMGLTDEQAQAQAMKAQKQSSPVKSTKVGGKKNLLKPDGTPYAPWMRNIAEYDPTIIKKRTDATGRLAMDPQSGELSGLGVTWKMLGDELELSWATGAEEGNRGFVVYRRPGKSPDWQKVSDFRDKPAELASLGSEGGKYSFLVPDPSPGTWVYRVSDVDQNNQVADLSQVLVEIESAEDSKTQKIALAILLAVLALAVFAGLSLDPLSST